MEINEKSIIYTLSMVIVLLLVYLVFQEPPIKTITKIKYEPVVETVIEEKIIYLDKECEKKKIEKKEETEDLLEEKEEVKKYDITSTSDNSYRYTISLFSYLEPLKTKEYKKVVFNGKLKNNESKNIFIMDVNLAILENSYDVYFQVIDTLTEKLYLAEKTCLYNLLENYIYNVDLEIVGNNILCTAIEDTILKDNTKEILKRTKVKEDMKDIFLNIDSNEIKSKRK